MDNKYESSIFQNFFDNEKTEELSDEMINEIRENIKKDKEVKHSEVMTARTSKSKNSISSLNKKDIEKITDTFSSLLKEVSSFSDKQRKETTSKINKTLEDYIRPRSI